MKKFKSEIIGFTKDNELVVFDDREEYLKALKQKNHNYSRVFATARDCVKSVNDEDTLFRRISKDIGAIVESYSIDFKDDITERMKYYDVSLKPRGYKPSRKDYQIVEKELLE